MKPIFISYRRDDSEGQAGRLFEDLREAFGADAVFMDVATIEPGVDFRRAIEKHTAMCGALLALIGRNWVSAKGEDGQRRLDDPNDFVRLETAAALRRDIPVIPVLVRDAKMVRAEELPADLKELAYRNGVELTHARWESDVQVLIKALRPLVLGEAPTPAAPASAPMPLRAVAAPPTAGGGARRGLGVPLVVLLSLGAVAVAGGLWFADRQEASQREEALVQQAQQAGAEKAAAEKALADKAAADKAAADKVAADKVAADKAAADKAAADKVATDRAAAERGEAERAAAARKRAAEKVAADRAAAEKALADKLAAEQAAERQATADRLAADRTAAARTAELKRAAQARAAANGECVSGYVWREARVGDKVCVTVETRSRTAIDNSRADATREPRGGAYGPNTCRQGYVWREAFAGDVVCVVPPARDQARADNAAAASRRVRPPAAAAS